MLGELHWSGTFSFGPPRSNGSTAKQCRLEARRYRVHLHLFIVTYFFVLWHEHSLPGPSVVVRDGGGFLRCHGCLYSERVALTDLPRQNPSICQDPGPGSIASSSPATILCTIPTDTCLELLQPVSHPWKRLRLSGHCALLSKHIDIRQKDSTLFFVYRFLRLYPSAHRRPKAAGPPPQTKLRTLFVPIAPRYLV